MEKKCSPKLQKGTTKKTFCTQEKRHDTKNATHRANTNIRRGNERLKEKKTLFQIKPRRKLRR